jgi:inorganic triphosphatase YgiF
MDTKPAIEHEIALSLGETCANQAFAWLSQLPHCTYQRTTQLLNVYFDTPEQNLLKAKAALRLRFDTEAQCWIQTLKTAGRTEQGFSVRHEWEVKLPLDNADASVTPNWRFDLFAADAQAYLHEIADALHPVFHTDFQRDIFDYQLGGNHFEFALDRGEVRLADERNSATRLIKDMEIEFIQGDLDAMQALAERAQTALNATPQTLSKAARGYTLML